MKTKKRDICEKQIFNKKESGITLVALVVTIVILIILALISISAVLGENGLIFRAESSRAFQANAEAQDAEIANKAVEYIDEIIYDNSEAEEGVVSIKKEVISTPNEGTSYKVGEKIKYRITVFNNTDTRIESFEIKDVITSGSGTTEKTFTSFTNPEGQEYLEAGAQGYIEYEYEVKADDLGKPISNVAEVLETVPPVPKGHKIPQVEIPIEEVVNYGKFELVKQIDGFKDDAVFIFHVKAVKDAEVLIDEIVNLEFSAAMAKNLEFGPVPYGTEVTIEEVYESCSYKCEGSTTQTFIVNEDLKTITFTNNAIESNKRGGGITNSFNYVSGKWNWQGTPMIDIGYFGKDKYEILKTRRFLRYYS